MEFNVFEIHDYEPYHLYFYIPKSVSVDKADDMIWDILKKEGFILTNLD